MYREIAHSLSLRDVSLTSTIIPAPSGSRVAGWDDEERDTVRVTDDHGNQGSSNPREKE